MLGVYLALLGLNILYMSKFAGNVRNKGKQIAISSVALLTWSYGIGGAVWDRIQSLAPQVELRGTLLTTMVPVLVSMSLAIYSPDGFVAFVGGQRVTKRMA